MNFEKKRSIAGRDVEECDHACFTSREVSLSGKFRSTPTQSLFRTRALNCDIMRTI